jgi:glycogen debranching enzyme
MRIPSKLPFLSTPSYPLESLLPIIDQGKSLITPNGIDASLDGAFQHPFGRDTYFTLLGLIWAHQDFNFNLVDITTINSAAKSYLAYMADYDDPNLDIYYGQLPHEVSGPEQKLPDFLPLDKTGTRAYISCDANGLSLQTLDLLSTDPSFEKEILPDIEKMTQWAVNTVDRYHGMIGYHGYKMGEDPYKKVGAIDHTWQDGKFSLLTDQLTIPPHPIYPVLEQGLYWASLNAAADRLKQSNPDLSEKARQAANLIQKNFNQKFIFQDEKGFYLARAVDGQGQPVKHANIDALIALGFSHQGKTILNDENVSKIPQIVDWLIEQLQTPYGLRNQGKDSPVRDNMVYHGRSSLWPFANGLAARALEKVLKPLIQPTNPSAGEHFHQIAQTISLETAGLTLAFNSPIETAQIHPGNSITLYRERKINGDYFESTKIQAWTVGWLSWIYGFLKENGITKIPKLPGSCCIFLK